MPARLTSDGHDCTDTKDWAMLEAEAYSEVMSLQESAGVLPRQAFLVRAAAIRPLKAVRRADALVATAVAVRGAVTAFPAAAHLLMSVVVLLDQRAVGALERLLLGAPMALELALAIWGSGVGLEVMAALVPTVGADANRDLGSFPIVLLDREKRARAARPAPLSHSGLTNVPAAAALRTASQVAAAPGCAAGRGSAASAMAAPVVRLCGWLPASLRPFLRAESMVAEEACRASRRATTCAIICV
jgi:hypothetical protein